MERSQQVHLTQPTELQSMLKHNLPSKAAYTSPQMKETPATSRHVIRLRRSMIALFWDSILVITPLVFIVFAILAEFLHEKPLSVLGSRVQDALLLAPTVFPIVFAALCGRMMRSIALYKSQEGLDLKLLEHLVGAQSIFSALERLAILRSFGVFGLCITLIWALSPVGGQALLRLLKIESYYSRYDETVMFLDPRFLNFTWLEAISGSAEVFNYMTTLYLSSLVAPLAVQNSPRDLWNNPKIPSPKSLNGSIYHNDNSWLNVLEAPATRYMNLIGIPIGNLSSLSAGMSSHMIIQSLQMDVRCTASNITTTDKFVAGMAPMYTNFRSAPVNGSFQRFWAYQESGIATSFLYVANSSFQDYLQDAELPFTIYYGSNTDENRNGSSTGRGISLTTCSMTPLSLESNVSCTGDSCAVTAVRKLPTRMNQDQQQMLSFALTNGAFCGMGLAYHTVQSSQTELFLADPASVIGGESQYNWVNLWSVPLGVLEDRFALAFNAFYYTAGAQLFSSGFNGLEPPYAWYTNISASMTERMGERYVCSKVWLAFALIISILLEIMAIVSAILRFLTQAPDIFGYVSSLTIDNEYCNQNNLTMSTALNGLDRARSMGRTRFRLMDVRSQGEVGHIAFVPLLGDTRAGDYSSSRVRANRLYD